MIFINDKEVNLIYNLGEKVKEVFSYGTKIWPPEVLFDYMYFKLADGYTSGNVSYQFSEYYNLHNKYLKISTDGNNWSDWTEQISMLPNTKYYVKGEDDYVRNSEISGGFFTSNVSTQNFNIECGGNVMSLCNMATEINTNYCFITLFQYMHNLVTPPKLPATTLSSNCYNGMFFNCTSLTQAPALPATTMKPYCYQSMFMGCQNITTAPELPATTLANSCYRNLLRGTSITTAPALPATTLADSCYFSMFEKCTSLTQAPALPATTLAENCYRSMFINCTSLTQAPELPVTTLATRCYYRMFEKCTSLTQAPALPATTLKSNCYYQMFSNSNKLNWIKALFTTTPSTSYTSDWVNSVSSQGVFVKSIDANWTDTGVDAVPTGWTVIYFDQTEGKYYTTQTKEVECDKYGNVKQKIDAMYFKLADGETSGNVSYQFSEYYGLHNKYLKISTDGNNWNDWTEQISMTPNVKYYVKGEDGYVRNSFENVGFFTSDVTASKFNIECGGNVMSLVNLNENITTNYCFFRLFYEMTNLLTPPELPATTLADSCYYYMFAICSSLTQAPELPATTLANSCYSNMFFRCSSLTQAPELPATTLAASCYSSMFVVCSSLTQAPELPATTLANYCYNGMFYGCSSLTQAPELPATTLTDSCYSSMLSGCSSLTQAPELPATTLIGSCYSSMFSGCSSLTQAPALPATTLTDSCYSYMFNGCSSLIKAPALPATTLARNCYSNMFSDCTSLKEITLNGDFNSSYATNWVSNVSPSGTFYNNSDLDIPVGVNGIPAGWKEIIPVKAYYMYFKLADGETSGNVSYQFDEYYNLHNKYLKYSTDGNNWNDWTEQISMTPNTKYYVKGEDNYVRNSDITGGFFTSDVSKNQFNIECGGDVMSLCNNATVITVSYCFRSLFQNITNLVTAPALPATTLADNCYKSMFYGCTSLTKAPKLRATTLSNYCYQNMFYGCSSLTKAPALPATTLKNHCYNYMFGSCTSLTEAPELPATRLTLNCYSNMFNNANKLNWIKALFTDKPSTLPFNSHTKNWVNGVSAHGVFVKNIEVSWTDTGVNAVPTGWEVIYFDKNEGKYYRTEYRGEECDKYGNPL